MRRNQGMSIEFAKSAAGHERHFNLALAMSVIPLTADLKLRVGIGSNGPEGDIAGCV